MSGFFLQEMIEVLGDWVYLGKDHQHAKGLTSSNYISQVAGAIYKL